MATQTPLVVGVFEQEPQAKRALDALRQAGFRSDQVGFATLGQGNVNLLHELQNLGVSRKSASYYDQEYKAGRIIVSVSPEGREQEARDLLHRYGGYDDEHRATSAQAVTDNTLRATSA